MIVGQRHNSSRKLQVNLSAKFLTMTISLLVMTACATPQTFNLYDNEPAEKSEIAILTLPISLDLVYHNGQSTQFSPSYVATVNYRLLPGKQLIGLQYNDYKSDTVGNKEVVTSKVVMFNFVSKAGAKYHVNFDNPESLEEALKLEELLKISLSDENGIITHSFNAIENPFGATPILSILDHDAINKQLKGDKQDATERLQYWWGRSNPNQQKAFLEWAEQ